MQGSDRPKFSWAAILFWFILAAAIFLPSLVRPLLDSRGPPNEPVQAAKTANPEKPAP
jgi:hypothetical protein